MDYESEIINFLSQKDNLSFVLDIAEKAEKVKAKLHLDFWKCLEGKLQEKLAAHPLSERWILKRDSNVFSHWSGISLVPIDEPQILQMRPRIEQSLDKLRLFYGLKWCQDNTNAITTQTVNELAVDLRSNGYTIGSPWWLGYKFTDIYPKSHDFWLKISQSPDIMANDMTSLFFDFIEKNIEAIERANQSLRDTAENGELGPSAHTRNGVGVTG